MRRRSEGGQRETSESGCCWGVCQCKSRGCVANYCRSGSGVSNSKNCRDLQRCPGLNLSSHLKQRSLEQHSCISANENLRIGMVGEGEVGDVLGGKSNEDEKEEEIWRNG